MGSDVERDGMFLELLPEGDVACAEVFYSDETHEFSVSLFKSSLPLEAVTWLIDEALKLLPERHANIVTNAVEKSITQAGIQDAGSKVNVHGWKCD